MRRCVGSAIQRIIGCVEPFAPATMVDDGRLLAKVRGAVSSKTPTLESRRRIRYNASSLAPVSRARSADARGPAASLDARSSLAAIHNAVDAMYPAPIWNRRLLAAVSGGML